MLHIQERENRRRQKSLRAAQKKRDEEEAVTRKEVALDNRRKQKAAILEKEPELGPNVTQVSFSLVKSMSLGSINLHIDVKHINIIILFNS